MSQSSQPLLEQLRDIHLPEDIGWFPLAWGWWASMFTVLLIAIFAVVWFKRRQKKLAAKRAALSMLKSSNTPSSAIELVRQATLSYFPRAKVASLTGSEWYQFLDAQLKDPLFAVNQEKWNLALYQHEPIHTEELVEHCRIWLENALPPTRRQLKRVGQ